MNPYAIDWSPSGDTIAIIGTAREVAGQDIVGVYLYSIDGQCIWSKEIGTDSAYPDIQWSMDGGFLAAIGAYKLVVFSPDGEIIYSYTFTHHTYDLDISIENMIAFIPAFGDYVYVFNWTYRPIPLFTYTPEMPRLGDTIVFNASLSYDPDGNITSYIWDFGDGTIAEGAIVNHTYTSYGTFSVTLKVIDDKGAYGLKTISIKIPAPPIASFNYTPSQVLEGKTVLFNALSSYDPDGEIIGYYWDFGDGATSTEPIVNHTFVEPGTYNVTLIVTDADGLSSSTSLEVEVLSLPRIVISVNTYAHVYMDNILYGIVTPSSPIEIKVEPGLQIINITVVPLNNEYLKTTTIETIELSPGMTYEINIYMPRSPKIVIDCNIERSIIINDRLRGNASPDNPITIFMEPGEAILNITAIPLIPGYEVYSSIDSYTFEAGTETTLHITLEKKETSTSITTTPPTTASKTPETTLEEQPEEIPETTTEGTLSTQTSQGGVSTTTAVIGGAVVALAAGIYLFFIKKI